MAHHKNLGHSIPWHTIRILDTAICSGLSSVNLLLPSEIRNKAYGATNLLLNQRNQWSNNTYLNKLENKKEIPLFPNYSIKVKY